MISIHRVSYTCKNCVHSPESCGGKLIEFDAMANTDYKLEIKILLDRGGNELVHDRYRQLAHAYREMKQAWLTIQNN